MRRRGRAYILFLLCLGGMGAILLSPVTETGAFAVAGPTPTWTRPAPLPFTPTPRPVTSPPGAYIELHLRPPDPALWTVVEWQDGLGQWHRVDGWQGPIDGVRDGVGTKRWWLSATLFGRGPFRWVALSRVEGEPLAVSAPFTLPAGIDVTAVVTLTVP